MTMADAVMNRGPRIDPPAMLRATSQQPEQVGGRHDPNDPTSPKHHQAANGVPAHQVGRPAEGRLTIDR